MNRQYHILLDEQLSAFIEDRRKSGQKITQVFVEALQCYRAELRRIEKERVLQRGYAESSPEDLLLLQEFRDVDYEAESTGA